MPEQKDLRANKGPEPRRVEVEMSETRSFVSDTFPVLIMMFAIVGLVVLGWYAYEEATRPRNMEDLPVIKADARPTKIRPQHPGGMVIPNTDKKVYDTIADSDITAKTETNEPPTTEEPVETAFNLEEAVKEIAQAPSDMAEPKKISLPEAPEKVEELQELSAEEAKEEVVEVVEENLSSDEKQMEKPKEKPKPKPKAKPKEETIAPPKKIPASMRGKIAGMRVETISGAKIQLGAYRSTKEAEKEWQRIQKRFDEELGRSNYLIKRVDLGSKGIFYRLQAGPIADARAVCKRLTLNNQGCFVVR